MRNNQIADSDPLSPLPPPQSVPKRLLVMSDTLKVGFKPGNTMELLLALAIETNIGSNTVSHSNTPQVFLRELVSFGRKGVVENADEILRHDLLRLEAVSGVG